MCSQPLSRLQSSLSAVFPQRNHPGTVPLGADPADHPAQLAEEQAGGGRALLQVSSLQSRAGRRGSEWNCDPGFHDIFCSQPFCLLLILP